MFADVVEEPHGVVLDHDVVGRQSLLHLVDPPLHYVPTPLPAEMLRAERERGEREREKGRRTRQEEMVGRDRSNISEFDIEDKKFKSNHHEWQSSIYKKQLLLLSFFNFHLFSTHYYSGTKKENNSLTSEETRAALETAGFLSTIACFMYLSMDCIIDAWSKRHRVIK